MILRDWLLGQRDQGLPTLHGLADLNQNRLDRTGLSAGVLVGLVNGAVIAFAAAPGTEAVVRVDPAPGLPPMTIGAGTARTSGSASMSTT